MNISFEGIGEVTATFLAAENSGVKPGDVVCMAGNGQVGLGEAGMPPCGVAYSVSEDGFVAVQIGGMAEVAYSGGAPEVGWSRLAADGNGGVTAISSAAMAAAGAEADVTAATADGMRFLVVSVDTTANTAVVKL